MSSRDTFTPVASLYKFMFMKRCQQVKTHGCWETSAHTLSVCLLGSSPAVTALWPFPLLPPSGHDQMTSWRMDGDSERGGRSQVSISFTPLSCLFLISNESDSTSVWFGLMLISCSEILQEDEITWIKMNLFIYNNNNYGNNKEKKRKK